MCFKYGDRPEMSSSNDSEINLLVKIMQASYVKQIRAFCHHSAKVLKKEVKLKVKIRFTINDEAIAELDESDRCWNHFVLFYE